MRGSRCRSSSTTGTTCRGIRTSTTAAPITTATRGTEFQLSLSRGEHLDYHQVTDEAQYISYPGSRARHAHGVLGRAGDREHVAPAALDAPKRANPNAPCLQ